MMLDHEQRDGVVFEEKEWGRPDQYLIDPRRGAVFAAEDKV